MILSPYRWWLEIMITLWTRIEDVFPIKKMMIFQCYVSLPEGNFISGKNDALFFQSFSSSSQWNTLINPDTSTCCKVCVHMLWQSKIYTDFSWQKDPKGVFVGGKSFPNGLELNFEEECPDIITCYSILLIWQPEVVEEPVKKKATGEQA